MKTTYTFEYLNEVDFIKLEKALKKYNMLAYKKLIFEFYPKLKDGEFLGELIETKKDGTKTYELKLPTDSLFAKVHGEVKLHYTVYAGEHIILLNNITPNSILMDGHGRELETYKGCMISSNNSKQDMFKINLLSMLE